MTRTLNLVSPLMRGSDVKAAQKQLIAGGWLRPGGADGVYGPETARAAREAHYWLGFGPKLMRAPTYGPLLDKLIRIHLAGKKLPLLYRRRRAARLKQLAEKSLGEKALDWLRTKVGDTEQPPGSNRVPWASVWYGIIGPWCAMGVTRAYVEAGSKTFKRGVRYAYVPFIVHDAIHGLNGLARTFEPRPGDLVCFDFDGDGVHDHVEMVDDPPFRANVGARFKTIGCNTSFDDAGSQSDGGACAPKDRHVLGGSRTVFVRVRK